MPVDDSFAQTHYAAELAAPLAIARIVQLTLDKPTNRLFRPKNYWLDMCMSPRPEKVRGSYVERWGPHRYERLGEIFLVPPGEALHVRSETGTSQISIVCEIQADAVERWLDAPIDWSDRRLEASLDIVQPHIRQCLFRLADEAAHPGPESTILAEIVTNQLTIELARHLRAIVDGPVTGGLAGWRLRLIDERLHQAGQPPSLDELAQLCALSPRQLTRGFRSSRGCAVGAHIAATRVGRAKRLLAGDDSIKTIAFTLGFASAAAFSAFFRQNVGISPRLFRQRQLRHP